MSSSTIAPSVYADLSAAAYYDFWNIQNKVLANELPPGWAFLSPNYSGNISGFSAIFSSGFAATAFINSSTNNIVISFEGTDFGGDVGQLVSDLISDAALGLGAGSSQLYQAALYYEQILHNPLYKNYTFSFTGHSLGAGLASVMAVWFGRQATVIDDAPFMNTADSVSCATAIQKYLNGANYSDPYLNAFVDDANSASGKQAVYWRDNLVTNYYTKGEVLNYLFGGYGNSGNGLFGTVVGSSRMGVR